MKAILSFSALLLIAATGFCQKQDVEVFEKKEGSKVLVMARNTGKVEYAVVLTITSSGMEVVPSSKIEASIAPGFMKQMATLTPIPGSAWEYSYEVTITQTAATSNPGLSPTKETKPTIQTREENTPTNSNSTSNRTTTTTTTTTTTPSPASTELSKAEIILYSKPGCGRCAFVKKQLTSLGIPFEEYSTESTSPEINSMWAGLRNSGFTGGSVTMPVVRAKGKYYYNIPDMQGFVDNLKKK